MSDRERRPEDDIVPEYHPARETRSIAPSRSWVDWLLRLLILGSILTMVYSLAELSGLLP